MSGNWSVWWRTSHVKRKYRAVEYCVETGHAKNIQLLLNTNGTAYDDHVAKLFKSLNTSSQLLNR